MMLVCGLDSSHCKCTVMISVCLLYKYGKCQLLEG